MPENQYLPLTTCPNSLAFISLHVSAGRSGMEARATEKIIKKLLYNFGNKVSIGAMFKFKGATELTAPFALKDDFSSRHKHKRKDNEN